MAGEKGIFSVAYLSLGICLFKKATSALSLSIPRSRQNSKQTFD